MSWLKSRKWLVVNAILVAVLLFMLGVEISGKSVRDASLMRWPGGGKIITIGHVAYAAGVVDYTFDGTDDNVQFQAALNALPVTGGRLVIVSAVQLNFSATVTRAIPNVIIEGSGQGTYFTYDSINPIFTAGGNNWQFSNIRTDAGGISMGATTGWMWVNVNNGSTAYDIRTPAGSIVNGAFVATSLTDSGLTNGRIPITGIGGLLGDDADITWSGGNTLNTTNLVDSALTNGRLILAGVGGLLGDDADLTWNSGTNTLSSPNVSVNGTLTAKIGRGATLTIAASDATALEKAQADYVATGANDDVVINAAIQSLPATGGVVQLSSGSFSISSSINVKSHVVLQGDGSSEYQFFVSQGYGITHLVATDAIDGSSVINIDGGAGTTVGAAVRRLSIYGSGKLDADNDNGIFVDSTDVFRIEDVQIENTRRGLFFDDLATAGQVYSSLFTNNQVGAYIKGNNHSFSQVEFSHNSAYGIWIDNAGGIKITASTAVSNSNGDGFYVLNSTVIQIVNTRSYNPHAAGGARGYEFDGVTYSVISGSVAEGNDRDGIYLGNSSNNIIVGNVSVNNDDNNTNTYNGITINNGSSNNVIVGNRCGNNNKSQIAILDGASTNNMVMSNNLRTSEGIALSDAGTGTMIRSNLGYITENSGTGTIITGNTSVVVTHGLSVTPIAGSIWVVPTGLMGNAKYLYIDTYTSASFTVHSDVDPSSANITFAWGTGGK